ncbi:MAG: hypothetical protein K2Q15_13985, partial [Burkholderiales bacterium]|nr:hypothetical protein [Burkholderiales bacterium]
TNSPRPSPDTAWKFIREASADEKALPGADVATIIPEGDKTPVLQNDPSTEATYKVVGFKPDGSGTNLSYTASRVCLDRYNRYDQSAGRPKVSAYITDWCQYDSRLDLQEEDITADLKGDFGRGFDLQKIPPTAYDKLIFSFMGVAGDKLFLEDKVQKAMEGWNVQVGDDEQISEGHIVLVDPYGDLGTSRNVGGGKGHLNCGYQTFLPFYNQQAAAGLLGGLRDLKEKARSAGHKLELAFSIGGWSLSSYFSHMAKTPQVRQEFINSIVDFFTRFPMFSGVDIDWEYPGGGGMYENTEDGSTGYPGYLVYTAADGANYVILMKELRAALDAKFKGSNRKEISIACSAVKAKMEKSNLKELSDAGMDNIYLMSYDLFGTPWAEHIGHHSNLYSPVGTGPETKEDLSSDLAISYLLGLGIPAKKINLGYANYGRACTGADLSTRNYENNAAGANTSLGTYENGAPEFFDIVKNYLDLEHQLARGSNGFTLMTDTTVNADFLYAESGTKKHFISLDTPRTVKMKGEYAAVKELGGIFSWSGDQDCGLLANAAREGAGYLACEEVIDMGPLYMPGKLIALPPITSLKLGKKQ